MIRIVMKPVKAPVVNHEGLYLAMFDQGPANEPLLMVRARNAACAEEKFMYLMRREAAGKTLDFNLAEQPYVDAAKAEDAMFLRELGQTTLPRKEKDNGNQQQ